MAKKAHKTKVKKPQVKYIFSWNDYAFGISSPESIFLDIKLVERPTGIRKDDWYNFASELQKALNKLVANGTLKDIEVDPSV